jgi:hypothetical protein
MKEFREFFFQLSMKRNVNKEKIRKAAVIREPQGVDFYVIDRPWTEKEKSELSAIIEKYKARKKNKVKNRKSITVISKKKVKVKAKA